MQRRHKRMELVRPADRKRRRYGGYFTGEIELTRRMFLLKGLILGGFTVLAGKLWKMQVLDVQDYEDLAMGNIIRPKALKAPRGLIVDRNGNLLADNRKSWEVAVIPARLPDDDDDRRKYVLGEVTKALDLKDMLVVRPNALPAGSETFVLQSVAGAISAEPNDLIRQVLHGTSKDKLISIRDELTPDDAARLRTVVEQLPGVHVMNRLDYLLGLNAGSDAPVVLKQDVDANIAMALQANQIYLPGVQVSDDTLIRQYPAGPEFSHVLGYVGPVTEEEYNAGLNPEGNTLNDLYLPTDMVGRGGLEEALEESLRGRRGVKWVQTDAHGAQVSEIEQRRLSAIPGYAAVLTLDRDFQKAVAVALQDGIDAANDGALEEGKEPVGAGVAIAMDPQNGDILALVSLPNFDNQLFVDGISEQQYEEYVNNPFKPLTNFAISGTFPPGSAIKPLIAASALQAGTLKLGSYFECNGAIRVPTAYDEAGGNRYVCWDPAGHGTVEVEEALAQSCDIFFYNVGAPGQVAEGSTVPLHYYNPGDSTPHYFSGLGIEKIKQYLEHDYGFGAITGIELAGEAEGIVPDSKWLFQSSLHGIWSIGDTINVSIGQGYLSCTPLQLLCGTAAIANGGSFYRPRLVKALKDEQGNTVKEFPADPVRKLSIQSNYINTARRGMRQVVTYGTAKEKFIKAPSSITIAGKTGTAEFGEAVDGKYKKQHSWFTAFAPYDRPTIAVAVLIQGGGEGATYAVPVADEILAAFFK